MLSTRFYRFLLELLLQETIRLRLFHAHRYGLVSTIVSRGIRLINGRALLSVVGDQHHTAAKGSHFSILRVDLVDVRNTAAEHIDGHVVAVLVAPISRFHAGPLHLVLAIGNSAGHRTANVCGDPEQVSNGTGVDQLVGNLLLSNHNRHIIASQCHRCQSLLVYRLEGVFCKGSLVPVRNSPVILTSNNRNIFCATHRLDTDDLPAKIW